MIINKRVLLICKESYSFPLFFIAKKLLSQGNEVGAFFIQPEESFHDKCAYNQNTYYNFKENLKKVKLFGLKDFCEAFNIAQEIDYDFLDVIERDYTHFKNLNLQLTVSQHTTRHYHNRFYFDYSSFDQNLFFIELGYKKVIEVVDDFKPDVILDTEDGELLRTILCEVAYKKNIPYITIDYPRFEGYKIPTYCLGVKTEEFLKQKFNEFFLENEKVMAEEYEYIAEIRRSSAIMSKEFQGTITSQYEPDKIISVIKNTIGKMFYFWNVINKGNLRPINSGRIIYSNPFKHFLFYAKVDIKRQILFRVNRYFETPVENETYVYMPLHLIPESSTFVKAPFFIDELNIIQQVSKSLPIGWKLYVKEHQSMVGERSLKFYREIKKIPNVRLVSFNYYRDPKPWIEKAKGVITITGTSAYEAALLGKKSIVFGDVPFNMISSISRVRSYEELPELLAALGPIENTKACATYLATIKAIGKEINLKYLISEGEAIIRGEKEYSNTYGRQINTLFEFYENAYDKYPERMKLSKESFDDSYTLRQKFE
jgi:hypothetical protein